MILMMRRLIQFQLKNILVWVFSLLMYSLLRAEYLYWNWGQYHRSEASDIAFTFIQGLRFDLSATSYLIMPMVFVGFLVPFLRISWKWQWIMAVLLQVPWIILNFIDIEFINFVGRRWTSSSLYIWNEAQGKMGGFLGSYWPWILIGVVQIVLWAWLLKKQGQRFDRYIETKVSPSKWKPLGFLLLFLVVLVVSARGGVQKKPISLIHANLFSAAVLNNLTLNSTFTILKSFGRGAVRKVHYILGQEELSRLQNGNLSGPSKMEGRRLAEPQNVVIIVMESFALEYMGHVNRVKGYTPFLDELSLRPESLFFKNSFANGRRSIEGIAAILGGIPALMSEPFISSEFSTNSFLGLGTFLNPKNYHTSFFHGGANGTMYFDHFAKTAGLQDYFGLNEYPNGQKDFDGTWGIYDRPFFRYFLEKLNQFQTPFAASFFSLSSHQPYKIPDEEKPQFPEGPIEILSSISYADDSLREFFAEAEKQAWYKNTLFVITADHTQKNYLPQYENEISSYKIPVLFFHPRMTWPVVDTGQVVQQIDILPSILDFLGLSQEESIKLGSSVFRPGDKTSLHYNEGRYLLIAKDYFIDWPEGHEPKMFSRDDEFEANPLQEPVARREELIQRMKAGIQYFSDGLWDNRLYYATPAVGQPGGSSK